ncbi:hypothetical protein COOONC_21921 [Cooperia oncophora]
MQAGRLLRFVMIPLMSKAVYLHENVDFDTDGFIKQLKAKGLTDKDIVSTANAKWYNHIATVIFLQLLLVLIICLILVGVYFLVKEIQAWHAFSQAQKEYIRYKPPPTNH